MTEAVNGLESMRWLVWSVVLIAGMASAAVILHVVPRQRRRTLLAQRIGRAATGPAASARGQDNAPLRFVESLGGALLPKAEAERTSIRGQLTYAGFRKPSAVPLFFGLKGVLAAVFPAIYGVLEAATDFGFKSPLFVTLVCALIGFYTPNRLLAARIRRRHDEIFRKLPDVMDLMIVCVEAGLGIDATLKKMAQELDVVSKLLAEEFRMLALELQAGLPRAQALQNLGDRNGEEALRNLARVLVQTERFGGGIGATLRTYIEMMSSKRIQIANEAAGRASVKLSFPLVGCILPALWIILMGPAILRLIDALRGHQ